MITVFNSFRNSLGLNKFLQEISQEILQENPQKIRLDIPLESSLWSIPQMLLLILMVLFYGFFQELLRKFLH